MSSNDMPKTLQKFFPPSTEVREIGDENKEKKAPAEDILAVGQVDSLLVIGNSMKVVEKIVVRLTGGSMPSLGETAAFQVNYNSLFRDVPFYGWVNVKTFIDIMVKQAAEKKENGDAPNPFDLKPEKFVGALGFTGLKTLALTLQTATDGSLIRIYVGAPESARQGLLKILAGEAKEVSPPPFIPASVTKLMRWRMDGQKAWTTLQKMLENISPQMVSGLNFVLDSADTRARDKDPGFDIRKNLIGNLGDDIITYQKAPKEATAAAMASPPSLFLLGSQKPEVLLAALRGLLVILPQGESIAEREFLGRKIYSVEVPGLPFAGGGDPRSGGKLHFAAGSAYAAFSTDPGVLEEYLRSSESQAKSLRETPGLSEAIQKVTGPGAELLGYENQAETMRTTFEMLRKGLGPTNSSASAASAVLPNSLNIADSEKTVKGWFDFSLLPAYDKVSKYFYFSVYGATATSDGLTLKFFSPVPPALRAGAASSDAPKK
jgi:hypothetical protein